MASMQQALQEAREQERKRIARDLHDQIIQSLIALNYQLTEMRRRPCADLNAQIGQAQGDLRQALDDVRRICANLRTSATNDFSLVDAIRAHLHDLQQRCSLQISFQIEGDCEQLLYADLAQCIFRVLQESLCNIQKHAAARNVAVRLLICPDEVVLTVDDDGVGFDAASARLPGAHFGLLGMHERLALVQGALEVTSAPGRGAQVLAWAPCRTVIPQDDTEKEVEVSR
jgi:signal transduction histidine kinase